MSNKNNQPRKGMVDRFLSSIKRSDRREAKLIRWSRKSRMMLENFWVASQLTISRIRTAVSFAPSQAN